MDKKLLTDLMNDLVSAELLPETSPAFLGNVLFGILLKHWDTIDEDARAVFLAVTGELRKSHADEFMSGVKAEMLVARLRGAVPQIMICGVKVVPTNHEFVVDVIHDTESGMWVASCDAIGLVTEARSYESLAARALEIAPGLALDNKVMTSSETAVFTLIQRQVA